MNVIDKVRINLFGYLEWKFIPSIEQIKKRNWNNNFITYMRNRMILGVFRYGFFDEESVNKYNRIASIKKRLNIYIKTKNLECLVDIANLCMIEFALRIKDKAYKFLASDDSIHTLEN